MVKFTGKHIEWCQVTNLGLELQRFLIKSRKSRLEAFLTVAEYIFVLKLQASSLHFYLRKQFGKSVFL